MNKSIRGMNKNRKQNFAKYRYKLKFAFRRCEWKSWEKESLKYSYVE